MASFFSKDQVERFAQRMIRQNQSRHVAFARFDMPTGLSRRREEWCRAGMSQNPTLGDKISL